MRYELLHEEWWEERPEMAARVEGQVRALLVAARARRLVMASDRGLPVAPETVSRLVKDGILFCRVDDAERGGWRRTRYLVDPREVAAWAGLPYGVKRAIRRGERTLEAVAEGVLAPRGEGEWRPDALPDGPGGLPQGRLPTWWRDGEADLGVAGGW